MNPDDADARLDRFVDAQLMDFPKALAELRAGRKRSHWIWYVLPQLRELGRSDRAREFGLLGLPEAAAYLAHPVLGPRLMACVKAMRAHTELTAVQILGEVDALKFRSCLTLFAQVPGADPCFAAALQQFYQGRPDPLTLQLLGLSPPEAAQAD
jgi:uncharacterized protein (DUF1810 family)